jgi:hypothetical protein
MFSKRLVQMNRIDTSNGGTHAPIPSYPTYTDYPKVNYADLWAAAPNSVTINDGTTQTKGPLSGPGSNVGIVLRSLTYRAYVVLPPKSNGVSWLGEIVGASDINKYGVYAPNVVGIWCHPSDVPTVTFGSAGQVQISNGPIIRQKEGSCVGSQSTTGSNGGNSLQCALRIGPWGAPGVDGAVHMYGWTLVGTDQDIDPSTGQLRATSGIIDYYSTNSTWEIFKVQGFIATWNAPPGETFQINSFRCNNCTYRFVETDGYNQDGQLRGGAFGFFATNNIKFEDCYFHDASASGWTGGASGNVETGTPSVNMTATRVYSWNNANHRTGSGQGFSCFNAEGVIGTAVFTECNFKPTWPKYGGGTTYRHLIGFLSLIDDCQVTLIDTTWNPDEYGSQINGAFGFDMPASYAGGTNTQVSLPVFIKDGVTYTPRKYVAGTTYNRNTDIVYTQ